VDRGPNSAKVVARLRQGPSFQEHEWVCLKGNHDDMMATEDPNWHPNGGGSTLKSYKKEYGGGPDWPYLGPEATKKFREDQEWMRRLPTLFEDEHRIFVHAGLLPSGGVKSPDSVRLWVREQFLQRPYDYGKMVVHGHTPVVYDGGSSKTWEPSVYPWRINLDTGACFGGKLTVAFWNDDGSFNWRQF
jgi:serine/threonine protein phosphatase 1